jgi:hypothetical protein
MGPRRKPGAIALPSEKGIQSSIVDHWRWLGLPDTLVAAIPNAGAMGQPGLTKGLPDLLVMGPDVPGRIGFIELKREPKSPVSAAQRDFGALCNRLAIPWCVCSGRDLPIDILEAWGVVRLRAGLLRGDRDVVRPRAADPQRGSSGVEKERERRGV